MRYDVIVLGAGHNGLTTAAYLAKAGKRVVVLERRATVGGCAVTEEVDAKAAPGCRVSTASYIASMLSPQVIRDLQLGERGLRMVACEPGVQAAFEDGSVMSHWNDEARMRQELKRYAPEDVDSFFVTQQELKDLAAYLQPFFFESPPDLELKGWRGLVQSLKVARRFKGITRQQTAAMTSFLTGSLGDFLDRRFKSEKLKRLILANSLYGKHGGPYQPGTAMGLLFHLLTGGENELQGFQGHVIGGMGAISSALLDACSDYGVDVRTECEVSRINVTNNRANGVTLINGEVVDGFLVVSNADPKRTFLTLLEDDILEESFRTEIGNIKMKGPCAKVNYVLSEEPRIAGMPDSHGPVERALFTLVPTLQGAEDSYNDAAKGELPDTLWVDCVLASNVDDTLAPTGRHMLTCFVQYLPFHLKGSDWDQQASILGDRVTSIIDGYAPGMAKSVIARDVVTPLELERRFGITEGNIFHGDIALEQLFIARPSPRCARYRTPVDGLYLCGAGTHPGGGVTAAPGFNAARQILSDGAAG